jgi:uncharacterized alpha-E superfamily protein
MLSRVADNLYWMSRYLERAEYTARAVGVHFSLMLERDEGPETGRWTRLLAALGSKEPPAGDAFEALEEFALTQMVDSIAAARENARQVREQIGSEVWEELNRLFHESKRLGAPAAFRAQPFDLITAVNTGAHLFHGIIDSTMLHGEGWQFIQAGRFIERVQHTVRLLDRHFIDFPTDTGETMNASEHMEWVGLLRSCTAFEAYCKVYTADVSPGRIAEFLLLNAEFPHAVRFGADSLARSLDSVHQVAAGRKADRLGKLAGRLTAALSFTPIEEIMGNLHEFTVNIRRLCGQIHDGIYQASIAYPIDTALGS